MSEHEKKWREEFEEFYATSAFNYEENPIGSRECGLQWASYLAAKRQDAERIAELESELVKWVERFKGEYALNELAELQVAALRAKLDALEKQEPVAFKVIEGTATKGILTYSCPTAEECSEYELTIHKLYAKPVPAAPAIPEGWQLVPKEPTDAEVDRMLSARIPGGSSARDWFLPHELPKGLANVRDVVRAMLAAAPKPPTNEGEA